VEVLVVHLANAAGDTRSEERRHEIDIGTDERRVLGESALVEDSLECFIIQVAKELMELAAEDRAADLFLGEELRVTGATRSCPVGCGAMRCGGQVQTLDCRAQVQR